MKRLRVRIRAATEQDKAGSRNPESKVAVSRYVCETSDGQVIGYGRTQREAAEDAAVSLGDGETTDVFIRYFRNGQEAPE